MKVRVTVRFTMIARNPEEAKRYVGNDLDAMLLSPGCKYRIEQETEILEV